jgi:hypothetical protein
MRWRKRSGCLTTDELRRLAARDLPARRAAWVDAHVRDCQVCADGLRRWQETIRTYSAAAHGGGNGHRDDEVDDQPQWRGFQRALIAEDHAWRQQKATQRRWSSVTAMVVLAFAGVLWYTQTEVTLDAEEALKRTVAYETRRPAEDAWSTIWVRRGSPSSRLAPHVTRVERARGSSVSTQAETVRELGQRLAMYGFQWQAPLSARPIQRWRETVHPRRDSLDWINPDLIRISTIAFAGDIRAAEIVIRQSTFEPVTQRWQFADGVELEWTSVDQAWPDEDHDIRPPSVVAAASTKASATTKAAAAGASPAPIPSDPQALELDTRVALQRLGVPVGRYLSLRTTSAGLQLQGSVATSELATRINGYVRTHPRVEARVALRLDPAWDASTASDAFKQWVDRAFSSPEQRAAFAPRVSELQERLHEAVFAFASLAERYPADATADLSPASQRKLAELAEAQYREVRTAFEALEQHLTPLVGPQSSMPSHLRESWRVDASKAMAALPQLSAALGSAFGRTSTRPSASAFEEAARDVLTPALAGLAASIAPQTP